jgi:hypothetical protein
LEVVVQLLLALPPPRPLRNHRFRNRHLDKVLHLAAPIRLAATLVVDLALETHPRLADRCNRLRRLAAVIHLVELLLLQHRP